jgi:hypothetical protein
MSLEANTQPSTHPDAGLRIDISAAVKAQFDHLAGQPNNFNFISSLPDTGTVHLPTVEVHHNLPAAGRTLHNGQPGHHEHAPQHHHPYLPHHHLQAATQRAPEHHAVSHPHHKTSATQSHETQRRATGYIPEEPEATRVSTRPVPGRAPTAAEQLHQMKQLRQPGGETFHHPPADQPRVAREGQRQFETFAPAGGAWTEQVLKNTIAFLDGKSPQMLEAGLDPRLGCARCVTQFGHRAYGLPITDSVANLESEMRARNFERVPLNSETMAHMQPGDIIVGHRSARTGEGPLHGHTAVYMGDGKIFNSNAVEKKMIAEPLDIFTKPLYDGAGRLHMNGYSDVWIYRPRTGTNSALASN